MPKTNKVIQSFNAGELSPLMDARIDQAKYVSGCRTLENFFPLIYGGAEERPGLKYIAGCKSNSAKSRLVSFEHSVDYTYILEFANQVIRVFKDGAVVYAVLGTETIPGTISGSLVAHWKMNENAASSAVDNAEGTAAHDGKLYDSDNTEEDTSVAYDTDVGDDSASCFDMSQLTTSGMVEVPDHADLSFDDSSDTPFSLHGWVKPASITAEQDILSKWSNGNYEYRLYMNSSGKVVFAIYDYSATLTAGSNVLASITANDALTVDAWSFVVVTYNGVGGASASGGMNMYINWVKADVTTSDNANYVAMEALASAVSIGGINGHAQTNIDQSTATETIGAPIGDMTGGGGLAAGFDADNTKTVAEGASNTSPGANGPAYIGKDWGTGVTKTITGVKAWGTSDVGFINVDNPTVTITLQGSANNTDWTDLGNSSFTDANSYAYSKLTGYTTTTAYRYHRLKITHDSGVDRAITAAEVEFYDTGGSNWTGKLDNFAVFDKELTAVEIASLTSTDTTTALEIATPYLTADLFELKFEHSADVMYITHPAYEPRRISRLSDTSWTLAVLGLETGPFRDQNDNKTKTITASATTGSVTLTATGHSPFVDGATAGHEPSGALATSKAQTGALFKLVHAIATQSVTDELDCTTLNDASGTLSVYKGITWDWTTLGSWGQAGDSASVVLERSYDSGTTYETVHTVTSGTTKNVTTSGTEEVADAIYRARVSEVTVAAAKCEIQLSVRDTSHIGIVEITAVASTTSATATVLTTLGSTDLTHRWSEGSFSNYRGWPIDVTVSSEERITFAGNVAEPLTTWGSVIDDWTDFKEGVLDDDAISFTLIGSGQQNRIRWIVSKDSLIIGTVGGEHLLGASDDKEVLSPTNVRARLQTTYGSKDIAAKIVNQAVIFVQRGGRKIRELLYDYESDAHKADDLTIFSNHITESGIVDMAFQRTPDPILWCVRDDGEMAVMAYERDQDVFSWSRLITQTKAGASAAEDSDFESVAIIYGGAGEEDEVWVSIRRTIGAADKRYIERFNSRAMPSSMSDMKYLDSYITDTGGDTTITGLTHLEGQTVQVLGDGLVQATKVVASNQITAATTAAKYQVGLGYTATLKPMKLDIASLGLATTKKIGRAIINLYNTVGGAVGTTTSNEKSLATGTAALFAGELEVPMPGGYSRTGDIIVRQTDPLPMTVLSLTLDVGASAD